MPYSKGNFVQAHPHHSSAAPGGGLPYDDEVSEERLPFTIRLVRDEAALQKAIHIRYSAYARHVPELAATMTAPEEYDAEPGAAVLLAESRLDGAPLGTMRIQTNRFKPLTLERSVTLPPPIANGQLATAARLGITRGRAGPPVKTALFKAFYQYCLATATDWMIIAARAPLDRQYAGLLFEDIHPGAGFVPLVHAQNIPHRVLGLEVAAVKRKWAMNAHPLYDYFFRTVHPEIMPEAAPATVPDEAGHGAAARAGHDRGTETLLQDAM